MKSKAGKYSRIAITLTLSFLIVFVPFTVKFEKGFHIEQSKACAATPVADAVGFIETAAQQTTLSSAEFVATVAGIVASSGFNISATSSITMGNTLSQNLAAIAPTDDYPAWSSLSSSEQNSWTSEDNYNAARFNSLMGAFDIDVDSYYSGGSFAQGELDILSDISDIGQDWLDGIGILYSTVFGTIQDEEAIYKYFGQVDYSIVDGSNDPNWPSGVPTTIYVYSGNYLAIKSASSSYWYFQPGCYYYVIMNESGSNFCCDMFSKTQTKYATEYSEGDIPTQNNYRDLPTSTYNGTRYWHNFGTYLSGSNLRFEGVAPSPTPISNMKNASDLAAYLLFNDLVSEPNQVQPNVPDYPGSENVNNDVEIYFPINGINDDTSWDELITYQEQITEDLSGIITLLQRIDSDLNSGFGKFLFDNDHYLLVKDPAIYSLLNTLASKFHFNSDGELLVNDPKLRTDFGTFVTSFNNFVTAFNAWKSLFSFYNTGELKVHDLGVYNELSDIYSLLLEISGKMSNWGDIEDAPDIIGDFDFDDIADRVPNLLDVIENVAPFGAMLILTELYAVISSINPIDDPQFVVPFQFGGLDDNQEVTIDLSWMDDIKPVINFFCILMLLLAMTRVTMRIVELEAAS